MILSDLKHNLKKKLIKISKIENLNISIPTKEAGARLDKLFFLLGHNSYNNNNNKNHIEFWVSPGQNQSIKFKLNELVSGDYSYTTITISELLNYIK